jgi:Na+-driven multidrug efflux pump
MLAISSAGIVDGYFIGNYVGAKGLAAMNITLPIFSLFFGVALALGIGGSVMSGRLLARGDKVHASVMFTKTILTVLVISLSGLVLLLLGMESLLGLMGANGKLLPLSAQYLSTMLYFFPFLMVGIALDHFARTDNRPGLAFAGLAISAGANMLLDWLFVARLGWGLQGAALATGMSFVVLVAVVLPHFLFKRGSLRFVWPKKRGESIAKAGINGFSEFINESSVGITTLVFNLAMLRYFDTDGVAAFSVITYWLWIGQMGMFGVCDALGPLISKNNSLAQTKRVHTFLGLGIATTMGMGGVMIAGLLLAPEALARLFLDANSQEALAIVLEFSMWVWPVFVFNGTTLVIAAYFTAMQRPRQSTLIALARSLVLPAFFIALLPIWVGPKGVFMALPLAECLTFVVSVWYVQGFMKKKREIKGPKQAL